MMSLIAFGALTVQPWKRRVLVLGALVTLSLGTVAAYSLSTEARTQEPSDSVLFCVSHFTGDVRHVHQASQCTNGQLVEVNREGPAGPQGPQGEQGPAGPPGPAGDGVTSFQRVVTLLDAPAGQTNTFEAFCPSGEFATGGSVVDVIGDLNIRDDQPVVDASNNTVGWSAVVSNIAEQPRPFQIVIVCAS